MYNVISNVFLHRCDHVRGCINVTVDGKRLMKYACLHFIIADHGLPRNIYVFRDYGFEILPSKRRIYKFNLFKVFSTSKTTNFIQFQNSKTVLVVPYKEFFINSQLLMQCAMCNIKIQTSQTITIIDNGSGCTFVKHIHVQCRLKKVNNF